MTGESGEARNHEADTEKLVEALTLRAIATWVRKQADSKAYGAACEWRNVADAIERESKSSDWRCECGDLNRDHEAFCYRCGAGQPEAEIEAAARKVLSTRYSSSLQEIDEALNGLEAALDAVRRSPDEAEVEAAIVRALDELHNDMGLHTRTIVAAKRAALDALRRSPDDLEARQRDIDERNLAWLREHHPNDPRVRRSPQGEDHEAGIITLHRCADCDWITVGGSIHGCVKCLSKREPQPFEVVPLSRCPSPEHWAPHEGLWMCPRCGFAGSPTGRPSPEREEIERLRAINAELVEAHNTLLSSPERNKRVSQDHDPGRDD